MRTIENGKLSQLSSNIIHNFLTFIVIIRSLLGDYKFSFQINKIVFIYLRGIKFI